MLPEDVYKNLQAIIPENKRILRNEPMSKHTSFKVGGPAEYYLIVENEKELKNILKLAKQIDYPITIVGNGTNILVKDSGIKGFVIRINFTEFRINRTQKYAEVKIGSGFQVTKLSRIGLNEEFKGLEFLCGIPGTVGGAIRMNAGAYGGEIKDIIQSVKYMDLDGNTYKLKAEDMKFSHRHSIFSDKNWIIIKAVFRLEYGNKEEIEKKMKENQKSRIDSQPIDYASAGSTFKRQEGIITAKVIDECGLKGYSIGGAQVSSKHAGFIVNKGNASSKDIIDLIEYVKQVVYERKGIKIETEIVILGE